MNDDSSILKDARDQLNLVLSFFPRVDAKLSTILAIDTAMLATMSAGVPDTKSLSPWIAVCPVLTTLLIAMSYFHLYKGGFPDLNGGHSSLIYFKDIASRNEARFVEEYRQQTIESRTGDVLGQVWRNAEILKAKFHSLRLAFITMACAAIPWSITLAVFAIHKANIKITVSN